ncbi:MULTISPECIES: autotransporter outer membrane beta-barrel domain-containing protein [unclassified Chelatococcus]|uniref:autotransporter outer membrane beta-barrel domain-containing protein n=1 Tax=unclassified Chelatococcus TaxID=2638111 RepID=UPI001BD08E0A|nr:MULTISPECIES: autotransporter outer membrane beta-barrel domain-containing protein [unclassified Chelatococcus]MBS7699395.1 autotransporter outer membrane beta-barrel domain-containing protein [Chelatococcus sp. YT9]MBX3557713.1 autotransporter outer membrane beta-barrel domain-containing protein [Chelatococcus sp.]
MTDIISSVGGLLLATYTHMPMGAAFLPFAPPPFQGAYTLEQVTGDVATQGPTGTPSGPIDCNGKLNPGWVSDGSHTRQPSPSSCPTANSGATGTTAIAGSNGNNGSTVTGTQQPKEADKGDHKGNEPNAQSEGQKAESSAQTPSADTDDMTARNDVRHGPSRIDVAQMALSAQRFRRALVTQHQLNAGGTQASNDTKAPGRPDGTLWMSPVLGLGHTTATGGGALRYDSKGVFAGIDRNYGNLLVGGMIGHLSTSGRSPNGTVDHHGIQAAIYGRADLGSFILRGDFGVSLSSYGLRPRVFATDTTQRLGATGYGLSGSAFAGYVVKMWGMRVVPEIGLEFDRIVLAGSGAAAEAARAELARTMTADNLRGLVGGRLEMPMARKGTDDLDLKLTAYWARDLAAERLSTALPIPVVYDQPALNQPAPNSRRRSPDAAILGAAIEGRLGKATTLSASYVTELRRAEASHTVLAGLRVNW